MDQIRKAVAFGLAVMIILMCAACGNGSQANINEPEGPVLSADASDDENCFACLVLDNEECYWAVGLTTPYQVEAYYSIKEAPRTYIQFVPDDSDDPIDDENAVWTLHVIGDEIPDWFTEEEFFEEIAWNALSEYRKVAKTTEPVKAAENETICIPAATGEGFACAVRKDGKVFWEIGVNSPAEIAQKNDLQDVTHLIAQIVYVGEGDPAQEEYMENNWQIQIIGDEIPAWFTSVERTEFNMRDALEQWIEEGGLKQ